MNLLRYVLVLFLLLPSAALAYVSPLVQPENQQAVLSLGDAVASHEYFGRLDDYPHTYTFEVHNEQQYSVRIALPDEPHYTNDVSLILVRAEKRGVTEVARTDAKTASWESERSVLYAERFRNGGSLEGTLAPGRYILEVSSPNNDGKYRLYWGTESVGRGYIGNLRALFEVKGFLGHSKFGVLFSPLIYVPLVVLMTLASLWYYKRRSRAAL